MKNRIKDKIQEIKKYLEEFDTIIPESFESYESDLKEKAACERYFEKIIESATDLAFLTIKYKKLAVPDDDKAVFESLKEKKILSEITSKKMQEAKGMRNLIVHQYGDVDDEIVFHTITEELFLDINQFIAEIEKDLNNQSKK